MRNPLLKSFPDILLMILYLMMIANECISIYVASKLRHQISSSTNNEFGLSIGMLRINLFTGSLCAKNVHYGRLEENSSSMAAHEISISNAGIRKFIFEKKIDIGEIRVDDAVISIRPEEEKADTGQHPVNVFDLFYPAYQSLKVKKITVSNPFVRLYNNRSDTSLFFSSKRGTITITDLLIDSTTVIGHHKNFSAGDMRIELRDIRNILNDSLYTLTTPRLFISYTQNTVRIDSLSLQPNFSKKDFSIQAGKQIDRFTIFVKSIQAEKADVKRFFERLSIHSEQIEIDSLHVVAYRNKYVQSIPEPKLFLQEIIRNKIKLPTNIHRLIVKNSYVEYDELLPPASVPGKVFFTGVNGTFSPLTNYPGDSLKILNIDLKADLFGRSPVIAGIQLPMNRTTFSGVGEVRSLAMKKMNSMLQSTANAVITDGTIDVMKFSVAGSKRSVNGKMEMLYTDLRVAAKDIAENDTNKIGLKIKTFIANNFILKKNNPEKGERPRKVEMYHEYKNDKFIINNLWQTLLDGIKKSIGIPAAKK